MLRHPGDLGTPGLDRDGGQVGSADAGGSRRKSRVKAYHQPNSAPMRLRQPVRKPMCMNSQTTQPIKPPKRILFVETTARPREM
jgi:hypothetical protein